VTLHHTVYWLDSYHHRRGTTFVDSINTDQWTHRSVNGKTTTKKQAFVTPNFASKRAIVLLGETFKRIDFRIDFLIFLSLSINLSRSSAVWAKRIRRIDYSRIDRSNFFSTISQVVTLAKSASQSEHFDHRKSLNPCKMAPQSEHSTKSLRRQSISHMTFAIWTSLSCSTIDLLRRVIREINSSEEKWRSWIAFMI
jgi:hypothetical protein